MAELEGFSDTTPYFHTWDVHTVPQSESEQPGSRKLLTVSLRDADSAQTQSAEAFLRLPTPKPLLGEDWGGFSLHLPLRFSEGLVSPGFSDP